MIYIKLTYIYRKYRFTVPRQVPMNAKTLILAILNFQESTGYEIRKMSTEGAYSYFVDISYGSIYPTLAKLEADGFVTS